MKKYRIPTIVFIMAFFCCGAVFADDGAYGDPTPGIIDHGLLGVADLSFAGGDLTAGPTDAGWVDNILQITTWEDEDWVQCWGAYPWDTTGEWIVYTSERYPDERGVYYGSNEIVKVKADGSGFMQLTTNDSCDSHASFVPPANDKVVFQRNDSGYAEIWIKDADDPTPASEVNLTWLHGGPVPDQWTCNNKPVVSHDGTRIAFHTDDQDIWVMDINGDGTDYRKVSGDIDNCTKHSWSDDDSWVLFTGRIFTGRNGGGARIFRGEADGTGVTQLSDENTEVTLPDGSTFDAGEKCENWPSLSPDGQWIAFHGRYGQVSTLSIMPSTGSDGDDVIHLVAQGLADEDGWNNVCAPNSWSPDSNWIAFKMLSNGYSSSSLFAVNIQTREIVQLTEGFFDGRMWWSPAGGKILFRDDYDSRDTSEDGDFNDDLLIINFKSCDLAGDVNGDGVVNSADLYILLANLNKTVPEAYPCADLNGDGTITVLDVRQILSENPLLARDRRLRRLIR